MATAQSRVTDMTRGDPVRLLLNFFGTAVFKQPTAAVL